MCVCVCVFVCVCVCVCVCVSWQESKLECLCSWKKNGRVVKKCKENVKKKFELLYKM